MGWVQSHCTLILRASLLLLLPPAAQTAQTRQAARSGGTVDALYQHDAHHADNDAAYAVPAPYIEALSPRGLRISIPDEAGISQVRFHLGVNKALSPERLGTVNVEVSHRTGSVWTYEDRTTVLRARDVLYFWLQVTRAGKTHQRAGSHTVQDLVETYNAGPGLSPLSAPAAPPPREEPPPQPPPPSAAPCTRSLTSVNGRLVCRGELLFLENFDDPDAPARSWRHDVQLASQPDFEFTAFTQSPANTYTVNGQLVIRPTLTDDVYGRDFVRTGKLQLENCTAAEPDQCSRQAKYGYILPPILSGRISTRKSFSFRYGVLEIRAKLPSGDWIYPELVLLPREEAYGPGLKSGRIQVALARGNADLHLGGTELGLRRLEAGAFASAGPSQDSQDEDDDAAKDNVVAFAAAPPRVATTPPRTTTTTTTTRRPAATSPRTAATTRGTTTRASSAITRTVGPPKSATAPTSRPPSITTTAPRPASTRTASSAATGSSPVRSPGNVAPTGSGASTHSAPARHAASTSGGVRGPSMPMALPVKAAQLRTTTVPPFVGFRPDDGGDSGDSGWPRSSRRGRAVVSSGSGYKGPARREVSRTELPGRPWSGSFHNYTLRWTPDALAFSVDGVELGVLQPEIIGGLIQSSTRPEDDPWYNGGRMAPFDREFYISLGLAVGGIHNFPDGVEGPNGSKKPWKNTSAKAMLSFWNAKDEWYKSWSTDSALLVDFVRVTAL